MSFKAYKAMRKDQTCRGFKFEVGETYEVEGAPALCKNGFHFCKDLVLTLQYYPIIEDINDNLYAEVEVKGDVEMEQPTQHKGVTNKLKIIRILTGDEVTNIVGGNSNSGNSNSGDYNSGNSNSGNSNSGNYNSGYSNSGNSNSGNYNSGYSNSGNYNSGYSNSGDYNSGYSNSGDYNSGDYNSGNYNSCSMESGFFNSTSPTTVRIFNRPCLISEWESSKKPRFLRFHIDPSLGYKGSFQKSFESATEEDINLLKALPNFDADVFFEISGIRVH